jgi:hypothetical protein
MLQIGGQRRARRFSWHSLAFQTAGRKEHEVFDSRRPGGVCRMCKKTMMIGADWWAEHGRRNVVDSTI